MPLGAAVAADDDEDLTRIEVHLLELLAFVEGTVGGVLADVAADHRPAEGAPCAEREDAAQADDPTGYEHDGGDRHAGKEPDRPDRRGSRIG